MLQHFMDELYARLENIRQVGRCNLPVTAEPKPEPDISRTATFNLFTPTSNPYPLPSERTGFSLILSTSSLKPPIIITRMHANPKYQGIGTQIMSVFCQVCDDIKVDAAVDGIGDDRAARDKCLLRLGFDEYDEAGLTLIYRPR